MLGTVRDHDHCCDGLGLTDEEMQELYLDYGGEYRLDGHRAKAGRVLDDSLDTDENEEE